MAVPVALAYGMLRFQSKRILLLPLLGIQEPLRRCCFSTLCCPGYLFVSGSAFANSSEQASIHTTPEFCAGHNKWSKVKNIKGPKDEARALLFTKLAMKIKVAVKEGGPNPELNVNLAQLIEQCRAKNIPKASLDAAIKGVDKEKSSTCELYEGRGPGGSAILIEAITDNSKRTRAEIKHIMNKNGGIICDGARHCFIKKAVIVVHGEDNKNKTVELERALELAIEAGAEDVTEVLDEEEKTVLKFICDIPMLQEVRQKLDLLGLVSLATELEYIPTTMVSLSDAEMEHASRLLECINGCPDVVHIYDNIE